MTETPETRQESPVGQGSGLAHTVQASVGPGVDLAPARQQLRRLVLDSVSAPTSKLAYGHALDQLFSCAEACLGGTAQRHALG